MVYSLIAIVIGDVVDRETLPPGASMYRYEYSRMIEQIFSSTRSLACAMTNLGNPCEDLWWNGINGLRIYRLLGVS